MKKRAKIPALVLSVLLLCSVYGGPIAAEKIPDPAETEETAELSAHREDLTYEISGGEVTVTGCDPSAETVLIPDEYNGYPVTTIGEAAFYDCHRLCDVTIGSNVTTICDNAFYGCGNLFGITLPDSVTTVGRAAFYGCSSLAYVAFGDGIETIGDYAFHECKSLKSVFYSGSGEDWEAVHVGSTYNYALTYARRFCDCAYHEGDLYYDITGGKAVIKACNPLATAAFIPDAIGGYPVTAIDGYAFYGCNRLRAVFLGSKIATVGEWAFFQCDKLKTVGYSGNAFAWSQLRIDDHNELLTDAVRRYRCSDIYTDGGLIYAIVSGKAVVVSVDPSAKTVEIPDKTDSYSVTAIGNDAFCDCGKMYAVTIGSNVTDIGEGAFSGCERLHDVYYEGSAERWDAIRIAEENTPLEKARKHFDYSIFEGMTYEVRGGEVTITDFDPSLEAAIVPEKIDGYPVTAIGDNAFYACENLISVILPESVTEIGSGAFYWCGALKSITIGGAVTDIGKSAFHGCDNLKSVVYTGSKSAWEDITIGADNAPLAEPALRYNCRACGDLYYAVSGGKVTILACDPFATAVLIPEEIDGYPVTAIDRQTFYACSDLRAVCFSGSENTWKKVRIPYLGGVKKRYNCTGIYENGTFSYVVSDKSVIITGCDPSLEAVIVPDEIDGYPVTVIGDGAFSDCDELTEITLGDNLTTIEERAFVLCRSLSEITPGKHLETIGNSAFAYCDAFSEIVIPESVKSIDDYAFYGCDALRTVKHPGSEDDWESIVIGDYNSCLTDAVKQYHYVDAADVTRLIDEIGGVTVRSGDAIGKARSAYETLTEKEKEKVENYDVLTAAEEAYEELLAMPDFVLTTESRDAYPETTVKLAITLSGNTTKKLPDGIGGMMLSVSYDSALTLTEATGGPALSGLTFTPAGDVTVQPFLLMWDGIDGDKNDNGVIAVLEFAVPAEAGEYGVSVTCTDAYDGSLDMNGLTPEISDGVINVLDHIPGDVNGDGNVNAKDVTALRRYVAGGYGVVIVGGSADVNGDGNVNAKDITHLRRYVAGGYGVEIK